MPEVLGDHIPSPRAALFWNGTAWQWALVDAAGNLQVDVIASGLPAGAATAANQALILAQVQAIEDLTHALQSVATDRLIVRGEDQLFSYKDRYIERTVRANAAAGVNQLVGTIVPAGEVWVVTAAGAVNQTSTCTAISVGMIVGAIDYYFGGQATTVIRELVECGHTMILKTGDRVIGDFQGCTLNDTLILNMNGYKMTLET